MEAAVPGGSRLVEVAPRIWVATSPIWLTNSTVIVADDGRALVVDPGVTVAEVDSLASEITARGWRVTTGFSTHPHWDHALWSRSLGSVPRWATASGVTELRHKVGHAQAEADKYAPGHDFAALVDLAPLPANSTSIPWAGSPAYVIEHRGHAPGHAALIVDDVLLAGDMLSDIEVPLVDTDAEDPLEDYGQALDLIERAVAAHSVRVLVPGHGRPLTGTQAIAARFVQDREYLDSLDCLVAAPRWTPPPATVDPRAVDHVADWHTEQLGALRARR